MIGGIMVIAAILGILIVIFKNAADKAEEAKRLKDKQERLRIKYQEALRGTDKHEALAAGRSYHAALRTDGKLTIYDEQAITNDLSAMKQE